MRRKGYAISEHEMHRNARAQLRGKGGALSALVGCLTARRRNGPKQAGLSNHTDLDDGG
jgi:hypothetical protein